MPELPEVETVRTWLDARLPGAEIAAFELRRPNLRLPMPAQALSGLVGRRFAAVRRRAKYLCIDLTDRRGDECAGLLVHLGMSGRLFVSDPASLDALDGGEPTDDGGPPFLRHEHWRATLMQGGRVSWLRYEDARRFGVLDVLMRPAPPHGDAAFDNRRPDADQHPLLDHLGIEPLSEQFDGAWLYQATRNVRTAIKAVLMDAHRVVGVGNIYASEACWRAQIDPHAPAGALTQATATRLVAAVVAVLRDAIADGGTSLRDFVSGDRSPGYFQQRLDVYGREGAPCRRCASEGATTLVVREQLAGRSTFRCPRCQPRR